MLPPRVSDAIQFRNKLLRVSQNLLPTPIQSYTHCLFALACCFNTVNPSADESKPAEDAKEPAKEPEAEGEKAAADSKTDKAAEGSKETPAAAEEKKEDKNPTPPKKQKTDKEGEEETKEADASA